MLGVIWSILFKGQKHHLKSHHMTDIEDLFNTNIGKTSKKVYFSKMDFFTKFNEQTTERDRAFR